MSIFSPEINIQVPGLYYIPDKRKKLVRRRQIFNQHVQAFSKAGSIVNIDDRLHYMERFIQQESQEIEN